MTIPRIHSIDLLKAIAMLLVINSHMSGLYGDMAQLATGGAIGDAFFFFAAGFLMQRKHDAMESNGQKVPFLPFIGNRIWRIYPTVWLWTAFLCLVLGWPFNLELLLDGGSWFVGCIMVYFVLMWLILHFLPKRKMWLMGLAYLITIALYFFENQNDGIYGYGKLRLIIYFIPMLLGSRVAEKRVGCIGDEEQIPQARRWSFPRMIGLIVLSLSIFYAFASFKLIESYAWLQLLSLPALLALTYYCWDFICIDDIKPISSCRIVRWLSSICLESYIIQGSIITICYRLDPWYGWLMAWLLILMLASLFNVLVKWVRLIFNYIF